MMKRILFSGVALLLSACAAKIGTENVDQLQNITYSRVGTANDGLSGIRTQALQETAMTVGAQAGLADNAKLFNASLETKATYLDRVFNFHALVLEHNVLPPVLQEGQNELNLASSDTIRISDRLYRIISQARFVTAPPHWRDYLWLNFTAPDIPDRSLLPQNSKERAIWKQAVAQGWDEGHRQCESIFNDNLARLKRDFQGMVLYRKLLAENMVSPPYVAKANLGVTGNDEEMRINDQILRITALPHLRRDAKRWRPAVSDPRGVLDP